MVTLSVLTPTYNRVKTLERLYESLVRQSSNDFEWIVIDDGSTDTTKEYIESISQCPQFKIIYRRIKNGGKHRALNYAMEYADSKLAICVDSDDWLPEDSIETIISKYRENCFGRNGLIGMIAKRGCIYEKKIKDLTVFKTSVERMTLYDFYFRYQCSGDTALIYCTDILRENKFPEFIGEKFVSENTLYFQLDNLGEILLLDKVVYLNEYQPDGLTANYRKLLAENPNGTAYMYYIYSNSTRRKIERVKYLGLANYYMRRTYPNCQIKNIARKEIRRIIPSCLGLFISMFKRGE